MNYGLSHNLKWRALFKHLRINPVIRALIVSDILVISAFGLMGPLFAVFLTDNIQGGTVEVVGFASAIWLFSRALFQIPIGVAVDVERGRRLDFWLMFLGSLAVAAVPLAYIVARTPLHIYIIQAVYGILQAATYPSWMAIFTKYIDHHEEGFEWSLYFTMTDLGTAAAGAAGGVIAEEFGFNTLFITVSALSFVGAFILAKLYRDVARKRADR